jgi:DNA-binding winged helix-turn-helix (wHTH) protein
VLEIVAVTPTDPAPPARLRFAGVVLDTHGHRLLVDGRQRACSTRAIALLQLLCQRPGQVWPRAELIDALWPGGQVVADESLSQLVFRLRAALGPYAECIATVRGVGVRLDARFEPDDGATAGPLPTIDAAGTVAIVPTGAAEPGELPNGAEATPAPAGSTAPPPYRGIDRRASAPVAPGSAAVDAVAVDAAGAPGSGARARWLPVSIALVLVLAAGGWLAWTQGVLGGQTGGGFDATVVDAGMGLQRGDLAAMPDQARRLVSDAFEQERRGDRERSQALMEAAHGSDASSPVPALMLALWAGATGDADAARRWLAAADARLAGEDAPYLLLLAGYVRAENSGRTTDIAHQAGALLDLRPDAWFLRLARAHVLGAMGLRESALAELQAIDLGSLEHPRLAMALADRASFGDVEGARAILAGLGPEPDNLDLALARARIDWSAGDLAAARAGFVASA